MGWGRAVGEGPSARGALGHRVATAGKASRVKMLEAWRKAVLSTASQSPRATPPLPP
jgi:hypothetical protein